MRIVALGKYSIMNNYTNPDLLVAFFEPMLNSMIESRIEAILSKKLQEIELFAKEEKPVSVVEISKLLGYSKSHIYTLCKLKKLPHIKKGKRVYFYVSAVNKWLKSI